MIDNVRGEIIGDVTIRVALYQPSGNLYGQPRCFYSNEAAKAWAEQARLDAISEVGTQEAKRLGWLDKWELRTYY